MPEDPLLQLGIKIDRLCQGVEAVKERQEMVASDVSKIKEAVYNPDQGLYARIRQLEAWRSTSTKLIWTLFTAMTGLMSAIVLKYLP